MSSVTVTVAAAKVAAKEHTTLTVVGKSGTTITLPVTSPAADYENLEGNWQEVDRPGLTPLNMWVGGKLRTVQLNVTIIPPGGGTRDATNTVEPIIRSLSAMCRTNNQDYAIALSRGSFDSSAELTSTGHWNIDACSVSSTWLQPGTNNISQATAQITLKEVSNQP